MYINELNKFHSNWSDIEGVAKDQSKLLTCALSLWRVY